MAEGEENSSPTPHHKSSFIKALPQIIILLPLTIHFVFVCFVLVSSWLPLLFLFSHFFFFLTGVWIIHHREHLLPIFMYIFVVVVTMFMDVIQLGIYFDDMEDWYGRGGSKTARTWQFSAAMMILSLMMKPITIILACVAAYLRSGATLASLGIGRKAAYTVLGE